MATRTDVAHMPVATYTVTFDPDPNIDTGGNEIGYAQMVGTIPATAYMDVPGLTVTFVAGTRPLVAQLEAMLTNDTAGKKTRAQILLDGVTVGFVTTLPQAVSSEWGQYARTVRLPALVAGSTHTVRVQIGAVSTGIAYIAGDPVSPASLTVVTR